MIFSLLQTCKVSEEVFIKILYTFLVLPICLVIKTEGSLSLVNSRFSFDAAWEVGWQQVEETEWEGLFTGDYHFNRFTSIFAGVDLLGEGSSTEKNEALQG